MKIEKSWMMLAIALVGLCTISCGGDDDEDVTPDNNGNTTEVTTDYTVTTTIKTVTLLFNLPIEFYQDYNNRYSIILYDGTIRVVHECRSGGGWTSRLSADVIKNCGIEAVGKVSNLTDIVSKDVAGGSGFYESYGYYAYRAPFQPNYGYSIKFTTEEAEQKYMRVYANNYKLNDFGELESVTIQYQLY